IRDPHVAAAIDREPAAAEAALELLRLRRVGRGEPRDVVASGVRDPDPILLIDAEMKRSAEIAARTLLVALADDPPFGDIALREVEQLILRDAERPHVAARRDDDALHQSELASERDALRRRQRLAILVEHRERLAAVGRKPRVVLGVDRSTERAAL